MTNAVNMTYSVAIDWDNDSSFLTAGDDITSYVLGISINLGIDDPMRLLASVGSCTLTLKNTTRNFSPLNSSGAYYQKLVPRKPVRVQITDGVTTWTLFRGFTDEFVPTSGAFSERQCTVQCFDYLSQIQSEGISMPLQSSILSGTLVRHILNAALKAAIATATITMLAVPANNDTLTINGVPITWKTTLSGAANEIKIGADVNACTTNAAAYINQDTGNGTLYSSTTTLPRTVTAAPSYDTSYGSSNQDTTVALETPSGAGGGVTWGTTDNLNTIIGNSGGATDAQQAQSFIPTSGILSQFTIRFNANTGTPTGTVTWEARADNSGVPTGAILATGTFTPVVSSVNTVTITNGPYLSGSETAWIVLRSTNLQSSGNAWNISLTSPSTYANGNRAGRNDGGSSWVADTSNDFNGTMTTAASSEKVKLSQSFQLTSAQALVTAQLQLVKSGSPTGTLTLRIETDNAGSPSGSLVDANATTTLAESGLTTSLAMTTFTFTTPPALLASTTYHLVLSTTRAASAANYVRWGADGSSPGYTLGTMKAYISAVWTDETKDAVFSLGSATIILSACLRGAVGNSYTIYVSGSWASFTDPTNSTSSSGGASLASIGNIGGFTLRQAQSFQLTMAGQLYQFTVDIGPSAGTPSGTMTWEFWTDIPTAGGATLMATGTFTPVASSTNTITPATGPGFQANTTYWLVLKPTSPQASGSAWRWELSSGTNPYANGKRIRSPDDGASWLDVPNDDFDFSITTRIRFSGGLDYPTAIAPSLAAGLMTFQYAADNWLAAEVNAMTALEQAVESERGLFFVARDGTLTFKDKDYIFGRLSAAAALTLSSQHNAIDGALGGSDTYNKVDVTYTPLATLSSGIIAQAQSAIEVPPLSGLTARWNPTQNLRDQPGTKVVKLPWVDPVTGQRIGALSVITPLVATTDWTANTKSDGTGTSYTGNAALAFSVAIAGANAEITITNTSSLTLYITMLKVRGVGLHRYNSTVIPSEDISSQDSYGKRTLAIDLPIAATDGGLPSRVSTYMLARYKDPQYRARAFRFDSQNKIGSVNLFSLEIGDTLTVTDTQTALTSRRFLVSGMQYNLAPKQTGTLQLSVIPLDDTPPWILENTTYGVLGTTTRPAY